MTVLVIYNGTGTKAVQEEMERDLMRVLSYISHCTSEARTSIQRRLRGGQSRKAPQAQKE